MLKIYSALNLIDAYLVQGLLTTAGIESQLLNEYAQGGVGELSFVEAYPELWLVNVSQSEQARNIIKSYERRDTTIETVVCPHCTEPNPETFEVCWRCKTIVTNPHAGDQ